MSSPKEWTVEGLIRLTEALVKRPLTNPEKAEFYGSGNSWSIREHDTGKHFRNWHLIALGEVSWKCVFCGHDFDADKFACGEDCTGKH